jgi:hypothetical protein
LTTECGRNVCDAGLISVKVAHTTASLYGISLTRGDPKSIFDLESRAGWHDSNHDQPWLQIDFHSRRIHVSSYLIKFGKESCPAQRRWKLEGSEDGQMWKLLDDRTNIPSEGKDFEVCEFKCNGNCEKGLNISES